VQARTTTEARRHLAAFVRAVEAGEYVGTEATVNQLLDRWLELVDGRMSATTLYTYRGYLRRAVRPTLGGVKVRKVTAEDLDKLYLTLEEQGLKPASIRQVHAILRRAFGQAERWRWIPSNPVRLASPPPVRQAELAPPSTETVVRLVARVRDRDPQLARFLLCAAITGARRGELCGLRWEDVDLEAGSVRFGRALIDVSGEVVLKDTKTHAGRTVAIPAPLVVALGEQYRWVSARAAETDTVPSWVFISPRFGAGMPWRPDQVTGAFRRLCTEVGVRARLHDLRHYAATTAIAAGIDVRTVAGRLGHADASTTLRVYSHFVADSDRRAAELLGGAFG
jgi:integrase